MDREALEFIEGDLSRATRVAESECAEMTLGVLREALGRVRALLDESGSDNGCDNDAQCDRGGMCFHYTCPDDECRQGFEPRGEQPE